MGVFPRASGVLPPCLYLCRTRGGCLASGPGSCPREADCLPISSTWQHKVLANTKSAPCKVISKTKPNPRYKCVKRKCFPSWGSVLGAVAWSQKEHDVCSAHQDCSQSSALTSCPKPQPLKWLPFSSFYVGSLAEMEVKPTCCEQSYEPGHPSMRLLHVPIMSAGQWVVDRGRHMASRTLLGPHFVNTRLAYLTSASGTLK